MSRFRPLFFILFFLPNALHATTEIRRTWEDPLARYEIVHSEEPRSEDIFFTFGVTIKPKTDEPGGIWLLLSWVTDKRRESAFSPSVSFDFDLGGGHPLIAKLREVGERASTGELPTFAQILSRWGDEKVWNSFASNLSELETLDESDLWPVVEAFRVLLAQAGESLKSEATRSELADEIATYFTGTPLQASRAEWGDTSFNKAVERLLEFRKEDGNIDVDRLKASFTAFLEPKMKGFMVGAFAAGILNALADILREGSFVLDDGFLLREVPEPDGLDFYRWNNSSKFGNARVELKGLRRFSISFDASPEPARSLSVLVLHMGTFLKSALLAAELSEKETGRVWLPEVFILAQAETARDCAMRLLKSRK